MQSGLHHYHTRKRLYKNLEQFPHPNAVVRFMDHFIFIICIIGPLFAVPQLLTIYTNKRAENISIIYWGASFSFALFWLLYGIMHKEKPIILANSIFAILSGLIAIGAVLYH